MLDKEYGKCLSSLWQIFGKKIDNGNVFGNTDFRYLIFLQFRFCHTFQFLNFGN